MEPFQKIWRCHLGDPQGVELELPCGERLGAGTRGAPTEECGAIQEHTGRIGHERLRSASHLRKPRRVDQSRPRVVWHGDAETQGQATHFPLEVDHKIVIMDENDVLLVSTVPRTSEVPHDSGQGVERLLGTGIRFDPLE